MSKSLKIIIGVLLVAVLAVSFGAGYSIGSSNGKLLSPAQGLEVINQVWNIIFDDYVDKTKLDPTSLSRAAIKSIIETLNDPYTTYLEPDLYKLSTSSFEGGFDGIGAEIALRDEKITIVAPIADSPAAKAGIRPGDVILEIDGQSVANMGLAEAILKIRGPRGTTVRLLVQHQDETTPVTIEIVRAKIELTSVRWEMKGDYAYIRITHFAQRTGEEMLPALKDITGKGAKGIVLDLRSNPGGLLDVVVDVVSYFIKEGVVAEVVDSHGNRSTSKVKPKELTTDLPVVVLVDNFSASGSEVLAGALQDYNRATIAGVKTYGKGSVNFMRQLSDGSGIYITVGRWLTPKGNLIEGQGISPDQPLELKGEDAVNWAIDYLKNLKPAKVT